jgi:hypothetical protein
MYAFASDISPSAFPQSGSGELGASGAFATILWYSSMALSMLPPAPAATRDTEPHGSRGRADCWAPVRARA